VTTNAAAPIVVGLDESPSSRSALDWAVAEAARRRLPLRLVHAVEWQPYGAVPGGPKTDRGDRHEEILIQAGEHVQATAPGIDTTAETIDGGAAGVLVEESQRATMVVVGSRGHGELRSLFGGSVGVQVGAHAHCPVVVVRPHVSESSMSESERHGIGRVVVGVDGSKLSENAIRFAFEEAALRGIGLTAVHAWKYPMSASPSDMLFAVYERTDVDIHNELLGEALAGHRKAHPDVPVREVSGYGDPASVLIHESAGAELLAVGSRGHGGFTGLLLGSVSDAAIRHAACPVAVIH
jgi:nucleotide-binding universal stress UspA family protein